jgi:hypothetical protein
MGLPLRQWGIAEQVAKMTPEVTVTVRCNHAGLPLRRDGIPLALWNRDHQAALPDQNVYGSHPILIDVREGAPAPAAA